MEHIAEVVIRLFVASDQRRWDEVKTCFAPKVLLDYSSMTGNPAAELSRDEIVRQWQAFLPGFTSTHHQLGNFLTTIKEAEAHVFCYGTATHYLPDEKGDLWTVVGSYDFYLRENGKSDWEIFSMKLNFKYQGGNISLPEKALSNLKNA